MGDGEKKTWTKYLKYLNDIFWYEMMEFYPPHNPARNPNEFDITDLELTMKVILRVKINDVKLPTNT